MDPSVIKLFGVMMAILIPVAAGGGLYVLLASFVQRSPSRRVPPEVAEFDQLRERIEELERREARVQEIEERLDFIERVLPGLREGRPMLESARPPIEKTPA